MKNGFYHENSRALLFKKYSIYQVRYPTIDQVFYSTIQKCQFVRVIRNNVILLASDTRLWIAKNNEYYFVDGQILDIEVENGFILVTTSKKVVILYYDYTLKDTGTVIDSRLLNSLLDTYNNYSIIQTKYALNDLLLLDSTKGVIALRVKSINVFEFDSIYSSPLEANYYSFSVLKDLNSYILAISFNTNQLIVYNRHQIDLQQWSIQDQALQKTRMEFIGEFGRQQFLCLFNSTSLLIHQINPSYIIKTITFESPMIVTFNAYKSEIYLVQETQQQSFFISTGLLIMKLNNQANYELQSLLLIATELNQCAVTINYVIYNYLDNKLYKKNNLQHQIKQLINYPTDPQVPIFQEIGVSGSNIKAQIELQDESISLKLGYMEDVKIKGIVWSDLNDQPNDSVYVDICEVDQYVYYLVQSKTLKATLYQCSISNPYNELNCQKVHQFYPNRILSKDSFQWIHDNYVIFGYISKFQHTLELYKLSQSIVQDMFTVATSLKDEQSEITSFTLSKTHVFVVQSRKQQIDIISIVSQQVIDTITTFDVPSYHFNPKTVQIQSNLLIITGNQNIIIGYFFNSFRLLDCITFSDSESLAVGVTNYSFFVAIDYGYKQEIREYSTRMWKINLLKIIPLFHYILHNPFQILSQMNLVLLKAYTPVLQQTVLLIYQPEVELRECLVTSAPLGWYAENELNLGVTAFHQSGLLIHAGSQKYFKNFFVAKDFQAVITSKYDSNYIHRKELNISYLTIDSPGVIEQVQNVTFLNLMTNIEAVQIRGELYLESKIVQIPNDWFKGLVIDFKIECQQCNDQIILTPKVHQISNVHHYEDILGYCQLNETLQVILTDTSLIFVDHQHYVKHQRFFFDFENSYTPQNIWCRDTIILITGSADVFWTSFIAMVIREGDSFRLVDQPVVIKIFKKILQLEILEHFNFILLQANDEDDQSNLCTWHINYASPNFLSFSKMSCIDKSKHPNFLVRSFITYSFGNLVRVFMNELNFGIYVQDFQYQNDFIRSLIILNDVIRISPKSNLEALLGEKINEGITYHKILKCGDEANKNYQIFNVILLTREIAHLMMIVQFEDELFKEIIITRLIQRYSDFKLMFQSSVAKDYLALAYKKESTHQYSICLYKLDTKSDIILQFGGIEIVESHNQFFSLLYDENDQLLLQLQLSNKNLSLYKVEEFATLTFLEEAHEQQLVLTASNLVSSASMIVQAYEIVQTSSMTQEFMLCIRYWILLILLLLAITILSLMFFVIYWKNRQKKQRKKMSLQQQSLILK
ncbi:unnamed protein product (macronuclear) [Paramecium tetraurelia]|uniref:Transmembrane protein n=1 Tax=Paramecium tetraurelia TaxID=5888 RepID=A0DLT2_PARTE|nr:uncharacterized protein GSPATT00039631001 [Paramecium tetraurelia]CAK83999.1 unnamed protein product [Paramecium tetraurelia]|eukprot:XP_001451396.1 hypothetical protein (macronuclear) [Paramecium tetraurelia strain d4-2]